MILLLLMMLLLMMLFLVMLLNDVLDDVGNDVVNDVVVNGDAVAVRPVWITFLRYSVVAVFAVICSKTMANGQLSLLKNYPNLP